jgi:hypothetical protein
MQLYALRKPSAPRLKRGRCADRLPRTVVSLMPLRRPRRLPAQPTGKGSGTIIHFRPHPWHGLEAGPDPPEVLNAYIEITPFDLMKYEVDCARGAPSTLLLDLQTRAGSARAGAYCQGVWKGARSQGCAGGDG